ncbi:hypothetical protein O7614_26640 [Micromonospora sp. WMMD961]|uniref:hypothetical protein n=1 Tax=Micromonospora sp. WMMD961 TaxID=3016100 RepID=UPI002417C557|nr:hypothetical protein [Micromonospora sp. WMMD961]MDG4783243.1 hypothetical protein [Micromonospora sp. WMMD961]
MAITSYPFDDQDTSETQYSRLFRELQDSGVVDSITGTGFQVSADSSGMNVKVQPGYAIERGHAVSSTAVEPLTIGASTSAARIDRVVLRLDPTANGINLAVLPGTPGAGVPSLTQTDTGLYEMALARVTVDANALTIAPDKVTDERPFAGQRVGSWRTSTRPTSPRYGRLGINLDTGKWEFHNGSGWVDLIPATVDNSIRWGGFTVTVSKTTPSGTPTADRIWIQPTS